MIPGKAKVVKCPYCGAKKELMTLCSGNTIGIVCWSDNKEIAPMLPRVSPVQKCPKCGKYYLQYKLGEEVGKDISFELGNMSFFEWKEAYLQFKNDDTGLDKTDWEKIRKGLMHAYNDCFSREKSEQEYNPIPEEFAFFVDVVDVFIEEHVWHSEQDMLLKAELYRETGRFKECLAILNSIDENSQNDLFHDIKERAEHKDVRVFRILDVEERLEKNRKEWEEKEETRRQNWIKTQMKDPRWKMCECGHCIKNIDERCRWCDCYEVVGRIDKDTPIKEYVLYVGQKEGKWVLTTDPQIEGRSERIRKITVEIVGEYKYYYHLDGQNPDPLCGNELRLGNDYIAAEELTHKCDLLIDDNLEEVVLEK